MNEVSQQHAGVVLVNGLTIMQRLACFSNKTS